jgi:hypothetical protein
MSLIHRTFPLDFMCKQSVHVRRQEAPHMDPHTKEATLKASLKEMRERLEQAIGIAKAAEACADSSNVDKAIEIALDLEQLIYEVNTFLNAASMIRRIGES